MIIVLIIVIILDNYRDTMFNYRDNFGYIIMICFG